jgi:hypothetical protein
MPGLRQIIMHVQYAGNRLLNLFAVIRRAKGVNFRNSEQVH